MANLTAKQVNQLANDFLGLAQAVGDYRYKNFKQLSTAESQKIADLQWSILNYSEDLFAASAILVMDDAEHSLAAINGITESITETINALKSVQKVITIAASIVTLGASILSKNPQAIADAFDKLSEAWNEE